MPDWLAVISKLNPLTYGVDAIRQIFLGPLPGIGVTIGDHVVTLGEEIAIISGLGTLLLGSAVVAFNRRD